MSEKHRRVIFYFSRYDSSMAVHLFPRFSNKDIPMYLPKNVLPSIQKTSVPLLPSSHQKKNVVQIDASLISEKDYIHSVPVSGWTIYIFEVTVQLYNYEVVQIVYQSFKIFSVAWQFSNFGYTYPVIVEHFFI